MITQSSNNLDGVGGFFLMGPPLPKTAPGTRGYLIVSSSVKAKIYIFHE